jgi:hypothetical protein
MIPSPPIPARLDPSSIALLQGPVAVLVAGRDPDHVPTLVRASGIRVAPDGARVTVYVAASRAAALLDDVRTTGAVAMVVNRPRTHQSIQLKGTDAVAGPLGPDDPPHVAAYLRAWVGELAGMGYGEDFAEALVGAAPDDLAAVRFTPSLAFSQSPGPDAGRPLA